VHEDRALGASVTALATALALQGLASTIASGDNLRVAARATTRAGIFATGGFVAAACGARTELHVAGLGGHGGRSTTTVTATGTTTTSSSSTSTSSSGTGGGCTTDAECGCLLNCCGGRCVNQANDILNCGGCGSVCPGPHPYCKDGMCSTPPCQEDAGACGAGSFCCTSKCCAPGQLCCTTHAACCDVTECRDPTPEGTCPIGAPCTECASPDTPIETPDGARAIASLRPGDFVYSVEDGAVVVVPVIRTSTTRVRKHHVIEVALANGAALRISPRHPTADGHLFADLVAGDHLGEVQILAVKLVPYDAEATYDILPASTTGFYFAGGALVGSTLAGR
jgi:hypothetical protein